MSDGTLIAVKQLSSKSKQGNHEFVNEIGMISGLQHPNLVKLHGCTVEGNQLLLVYEYMENNCISRALFGEIARLIHCLNEKKNSMFLMEPMRERISTTLSMKSCREGRFM